MEVIGERDCVSGDGSETGGFVPGAPQRPAVPPVLADNRLDKLGPGSRSGTGSSGGAGSRLGSDLGSGLGLEDDRSKPRWPIAWFAFTAVFALTGATALILPHLAPVFGGKGSVAAAPSVSPSAARLGAVACAVDRHDPGYCSRYVKDVARRVPLAADERGRMESETKKLDSVIWTAHPAPGQQPADAVRAVLTAAGYTDTIVRAARPDDPAPSGSTIFAVPLGSDCVVGHLDTPGAAISVLLGQLPDGRCLLS